MNLVNKVVPSHDRAGDKPSPVRTCILVIGYLVAISAALSLFSVPLYVSFLLLVTGAVIGTLAYRATPAMTWRSWLVLILGCVVILGVLNLFGQERVRYWKPHPAGYIVAWFVCFQAFRHVRFLLSQHDTVTNSGVARLPPE